MPSASQIGLIATLFSPFSISKISTWLTFAIVVVFEWRKQKIFLIKNGNRDRFSKSTGFQNLSF